MTARTRLLACMVSTVPPVAVASRRHGGHELAGPLARLQHGHGPVRVHEIGSSLKLCMLAEGIADLNPSFVAISNPRVDWTQWFR